MKFVYNIYVLIIILRSTRVVQNAADFSLDELTYLSRELNPIECMRLLEAIYLAIPSDKEHRVIKKNPVNTRNSKRACLNELKTWNRQFTGETGGPKARVVMISHLKALGRSDLANWVRKNRESLNPVYSNGVQFEDKNVKTDQDNVRIFKIDTSENRQDHHLRAKRVNHRIKRAKTPRRNSQLNSIHRQTIAAISGEAVPSRSQSEKWKHAMSKNSLFLMIALGIVVTFICGIVFLIFRKTLRNSLCCTAGERSDFYTGNSCTCTREKGLQCIGCPDDTDDLDTPSNAPSEISEIDVEGGSGINSAGIEGGKSYSDTSLLYNERIMPKDSLEKLKLLRAKSVASEVSLRETQPLSSCRCRPLEKKVCTAPRPKKKKKKAKAKAKEETKSTKNYLKAMQEKILPRRTRKVRKDCTFDMKQFQDKIITILNQECGVCQCCKCTPHRKADGYKLKSRCAKQEKKVCKNKQNPKRDKCEKLSITKGCNKDVLTYQASVNSRSPMSARRSTRKQESSLAKKSEIKDKEKSGKLGSPGIKRAKDDRVLIFSSSDTDQPYNGNKDGEKRSKFRPKRSEQPKASSNTLLSAHDEPKRFF